MEGNTMGTRKYMAAIAAALACVSVAYADGMAVEQAAKSPEMAGELASKTTDVPKFSADVIKAIAALPTRQSERIKAMAEVARQTLGASNGKNNELFKLFAQQVMAMQFTFFPAWVKMYKPDVDVIIDDMPETPYRSLVAATLEFVKNAGDEDDVMLIYTAFAVRLLARYKEGDEARSLLPEEERYERVREMLGAIDGSIKPTIRQPLYDVLRNVLKDDYAGLLGPNAKIFEAQESILDKSDKVDVTRPNLLPRNWSGGWRVGPPPPPPHPTPDHPHKPPTPPPYREQF